MTTKPLIVLLDPLELYLPILLPGIDEEEYANQLVDEDEADNRIKVDGTKVAKEPEEEVDGAWAKGGL